MPSQLMLIRDHDEVFSLQPSRGMPLAGKGAPANNTRWSVSYSQYANRIVGLNKVLNEFYDEYAVKEMADEWFDKHAYEKAMDGSREDIWMAQ